MFINEKRNSKNDINANIRYSQTSLNSTQNSDLDYNLYCFSQGYENKEKGFWRGVLRNKNIDLDLKLDKDWNRKIEFEDEINLSETQSQISNVETDIISIMNEAEIGWDKNLFQNFKKKQAGIKKPKNKEWLISNGLKRGQQNTTVELRTQNYKQFEENEKNKRLKKNDKALQYKQELILETKKYGTNDYNLIKSYAGSDTKKTGSSTYNTYGQSDSKIYTRNINNINANKNQRSPRIESQNNYGIKRQEIRIGQNYNTNVQKKLDDQYIQAFTVDDRPKNLVRLEISVERKSKNKHERKPESRKHERIHSSKKKRKVSLDKYGKPLTNTSRVNIDTSTKKQTKDRIENRSRLEVSVGKKEKKEGRKPSSRQHKRYSSEKKKRISVDSQGRPLTNTSRLNVDTSTKKKPKDRLENRSRLEVSVGKKEKKEGRKPSSRQHRKYSSEKKKRISVDSQGRPLANTSRVNIDTSTKKKPKDRLENRSRLEVSVGKKEKKEGRKPSSRRHSKISSEKKKRISLDSQGKPLTNVNRLRVGYEKGEVKYAQLEDFDKYEDKSHQRHQVFQTESNKYNKQYNQPSTKYTQMKTPIKSNLPQKTIKTQIHHRRQLTGQISSQKISEAGNAFFSNKYKYERIKKEDAQSNKATYKTQQSKGKESSYTNMRYGVSTSKLNTAETNASEKRPRFDKGIDISKTSLFDNKKEQTQINRNYSYNKDLINSNKKTNTNANTNTNNNNINKRRTSEMKTLDFSKYYKKYKEEKPKPKQTTTYQKPIDNINGNEIYEYVPISSSKKNYTNNSTYSNSSKVHKKNQKEFSIDLTKYNGVFNKNYPQTIEVSEETQTSENKRNRSSAANQRFSFSQNAMAYFKLQFVTTKQVVDKFWKSIDNGELSIAMFNNQRNMSKLSNYVSPAKNKMTKNNEINGKMRQSYKV